MLDVTVIPDNMKDLQKSKGWHVATRYALPLTPSLLTLVLQFRRRNTPARCSRLSWRMTATLPQPLGKPTLNLPTPVLHYVLLIQPDLQALILNPPPLFPEQALIRLVRLSGEIVQLQH